jgi:ketosteroid isomerase-like protein
VDRAHVEGWIRAYERAWRAHDAGAVAALFTADATYRASPLAPPVRGIDAITAWWRSESDPAERWELTSEVLAVDGPVAVARLDVRYSAPTEVRYLDLWVMRFAPGGRCDAFEEWWWRHPPRAA